MFPRPNFSVIKTLGDGKLIYDLLPDLIFVAFFHSPEEQRQFFLEELSGIEGIIRTETFNVLKNVKTKYLWGVSALSSERKGDARKGR